MGNRRWMGKNPAVCVRMSVRRLLMSFVLFVVLTEKEGPSILQRTLSTDCNRAARSVECANQICLSPSQKSVRKYFAEAFFFSPLRSLVCHESKYGSFAIVHEESDVIAEI